MNCLVHTSECIYTSTSEFATGLMDSHFQLLNPLSAPFFKHTTMHVSKQVPSPSFVSHFRESGKGAYLCSPHRHTDRELVSPARTQAPSPRHNQERIVWDVPRHSHYPPFPYILQIILPFTNTLFSLAHQMPLTSHPHPLKLPPFLQCKGVYKV